MKQISLKVLVVSGLLAGLLAACPAMLAQAQNGSPILPRNGQPGMSPNMQPDGPMAPENNVAFTQQHVSDTIRQNMAMEIELSQLALKQSRNAKIKKFAHQVIAENTTLAEEAKQFAPDKSGVFPNPMFAGTREAVGALAAEKKMKNLSGRKSDQIYLAQMNKYAAKDQQVGHSAYAMMEFPGISPVGRKMWDMANRRVTQIAQLAQSLHIALE